ncbi:hypothetical protein [Williamsia maris]|uniref:Uncharacterized protein n=1 Tax=Williamsia maris TaxID=72806 RepID=A0ABT1HJ94_9NOCA|nr:hypothetical protein [Williamsia maris]MCP2178011.1 hypothetical protein [Williamsia maris]
MTTPTASSPRRTPLDDTPTEQFATTDLPRADAARSGDSAGGVSWPVVWRWVSFIIGTIVLVVCAWALGSKVPQWTRDHGTTIVFLCFFLVMSIAGRWFWMGIDAALNRVIGGR